MQRLGNFIIKYYFGESFLRVRHVINQYKIDLELKE